MAKDRSPNYPAVSLPEAIELARALYQREHRTVVVPDVVVKAWGYKSLSGPARVKISAMRKFGLLEDAGHGLRISDRAADILEYGDAAPERQKAIKDAALAPELFAELAESHAHASEDALRAYLVTREKFAPAGARQFIKSFRDTLALVAASSGGYTEGKKTQEPGAMRERSAVTTSSERSESDDANRRERGKGSSGRLWLKVPFGDTNLSVEVEIEGDVLRKSHLVKVRKYLELAEDDLKDLVVKHED